MGVPSFYRWLVRKYPKIVVDAVEEKGDHIDYCLQNPNELEFDNLYLDMNGIIHPCFHPEDTLFPPTTFDEVFDNICEYIDRLFSIVRPRKLLYLAIDGVAPRAKMNQQRSRRFRAAKDMEKAEEIEEKLRKEFELEGKSVFCKEESQISDSNVITPGTTFMYTLSGKLESYITQRISNNPAWTKIKVILSDDSVPGEGEHKIMSYIRAQRASPGYDPNTRHCLYGLDADLIMLALATHEVHFSIIREDLMFQNEQLHLSAKSNDQEEAEACFKKSNECSGNTLPCQETESLKVSEKEESYNAFGTSVKKKPYQLMKKKPYQFLHVWILREYLDLDMEISCLPENVKYDAERMIDDFILICLFAGNDFLPHIPCLEIHENAIDLLMDVYKNEFKNFGGYLADMQRVEDKKHGYMKLKRVERFLLTVGKYEDKIFNKRANVRDRKRRQILSKLIDGKSDECGARVYDRTSDLTGSYVASEVETATITSNSVYAIKNPKDAEKACDSLAAPDELMLINTLELKQKIKDTVRYQSDLFRDGSLGTDKVKFGSTGWKERYYKEKFSAETSSEMETVRKDVVKMYGEGLHWVLLYYFSGVPSWSWFYPYYYGPLASDFKGLTQTKVNFQRGLPFKPFDQLMGVLPPKSALALPEAFRRLMIDENSTLRRFYPEEFETDFDGKRYMWQGICKLPFIDERSLVIETNKLEKELKDDEKIRNMKKLDLLFTERSSKFGNEVSLSIRTCNREKNNGAIELDITRIGIDGTLHHHSVEEISVKYLSMNIICVFYETRQGLIHVPRLLEGVDMPEKIVEMKDLMETKLWHEDLGRNFNMSNRYQPRPISGPNANIKGANSGFMGRGKTMERYGNYNPGPDVNIKGTGAGSGFIGRGKTIEKYCNYNPGTEANIKGASSGRGKTMERYSNYNPGPDAYIKAAGAGSGFMGRGKTIEKYCNYNPGTEANIKGASSGITGRGKTMERYCNYNPEQAVIGAFPNPRGSGPYTCLNRNTGNYRPQSYSYPCASHEAYNLRPSSRPIYRTLRAGAAYPCTSNHEAHNPLPSSMPIYRTSRPGAAYTRASNLEAHNPLPSSMPIYRTSQPRAAHPCASNIEAHNPLPSSMPIYRTPRPGGSTSASWGDEPNTSSPAGRVRGWQTPNSS